jgi:hypothetical protein
MSTRLELPNVLMLICLWHIATAAIHEPSDMAAVE